MTIKGYLKDKTFRLFYVDNASQLSPLQEVVINYPYVMEHKIRAIGYNDHNLYIDPPIEGIRSHSELWVAGKQPLFRLASDPTDYQWTHPFIGNNFKFPIFSTIGKTCFVE